MLSDTKIRQSKPQDKVYRIADQKGLCIEIRPSGQKIWRYRYRLAGKASMYTIGEYPAVTLAAARAMVDEARLMVAQGLNPNVQKRVMVANQITTDQNTFQAVAERWMGMGHTWSSRYQKHVRQVMEDDIFPEIGSLPIDKITSQACMRVIQKIADRGALTVAGLARMWMGAIFRHGITTLCCENDPTLPLTGLVKRKPVQHHQPLKPVDMPRFLAALDAYKGLGFVKPATKLMMLTFVRTAEICSAAWEDVDLDKAVWRIPAEKMKMRTEHIVPLSRQAVELLTELRQRSGHRHHIFPNTRRPMVGISNTSINRLIESIGFSGIISGHSFRSTAATMLRELGFADHLVELQLAHTDRNKVRASYNHAKHIEERRAMMQDWADYIDSITPKDTPISAA
ncbi:tyrosine-type recombinase/integrase [Vogesella mureinivorans]|uniref:tyrosine-type recombinase/integrase n=1 Tax=Vogesella mureinivorans TaxID=657276 RepID=UPI0011CC25BA|nr:integrase arm-type DNA-binding domain-containing protein [Vogesella mureinivorans]